MYMYLICLFPCATTVKPKLPHRWNEKFRASSKRCTIIPAIWRLSNGTLWTVMMSGSTDGYECHTSDCSFGECHADTERKDLGTSHSSYIRQKIVLARRSDPWYLQKKQLYWPPARASVSYCKSTQRTFNPLHKWTDRRLLKSEIEKWTSTQLLGRNILTRSFRLVTWVAGYVTPHVG